MTAKPGLVVLRIDYARGSALEIRRHVGKDAGEADLDAVSIADDGAEDVYTTYKEEDGDEEHINVLLDMATEIRRLRRLVEPAKVSS